MKNITEDEALRLVLAGTAGETGVAFFRALAQSLSDVLGTMAAMVTEYPPADRKLSALAFVVRGRFIDGYEYLVENTPCALALEKRGMMHFRDHLPDFFPHDPDLREMGVVSYLGCPLLYSDGSPMGLLAVLDDKPMAAERRFMSLFELFAARAAAEHRRLRRERDLHARHLARHLEDTENDAAFELDPAWHIRHANTAAERLFGCTREDLIGESIVEFLEPHSARYLQGRRAKAGRDGRWR
jgi:PAS domain-containing protein